MQMLLPRQMIRLKFVLLCSEMFKAVIAPTPAERSPRCGGLAAGRYGAASLAGSSGRAEIRRAGCGERLALPALVK